MLVVRVARALGYTMEWTQLSDVRRAMANDAFANAFIDAAGQAERGGGGSGNGATVHDNREANA